MVAQAQVATPQGRDHKPTFIPSEVGEIPADWSVVSASDIGKFRGGNGFPLRFQGNEAGQYPYFKVSDMSLEGNQRSLRAANNYIDEIDRQNLGAHVFPINCIVIAKVGAAVFLERKKLLEQPSCLDNNMAGYWITDPKCYYSFIYHYFKSIRFGDLVSTTALPSLNGTVLGSIKLPMPPTREEQEAIAEALNDADSLIESLETLIAKQRAIKQGAMQDLLSGLRRLPGFTKKWKEAKLGSLGPFIKGSGVRKDQAQSGNLPCIRYGEIYTDHNDVLRNFRSYISGDVAATATPLRKGDVLFAGSGETKEQIGKCVAVVDDRVAYAGGDIVILRTTGADPVFLGYALNLPPVQRQKASKGQGDAVVHISAAALASIDVVLPELTEQVEISTVILEMDRALDAIEARLTKALQIKQGMMQELLTGRVRLV